MNLSGTATAMMDGRGRLRIPAGFRNIIEERYGREVFVTSADLKSVLVYPLEEWHVIMEMAGEKASENPELMRFGRITAYHGKKSRMDDHGRVLIHKSLRSKTNLEGRIFIEWLENHLVLKKISS